MKIITKFKDYYDHCVGYYGFDETMVYDRRNTYTPCNLPTKNYVNSKYLLSICGYYYPIVMKGGRFIFQENDKELTDHYDKWFILKYRGKASNQNVKYRQPVLYCDIDRGGSKGFIPTLSSFGIPSVIDADEMYQKIYAFLGWLKDNPEIPNTQTDKDKVVSHGFDAKRSFRPTMKS